MNYRLISIHEELMACLDLVPKIPHDVDIICGIPRHGMIAAATISEIMGRPLMVPGGQIWYTKNAYSRKTNGVPTILLVDDSIGTFVSMSDAKEQVSHKNPESRILTAAVYTSETTKHLLDIYAHAYPSDTQIMFHSQFMHSPWLSPIGYDMDGILCEDWREGWEYSDFFVTTKPYRIPAYKIDYIVTARMEEYRKPTIAWLDRHGVDYTHLIMRQDQNEEHGAYKSRICTANGIKIFIESVRGQAETIGRTPGVMCVHYNSGELFQ